MPQQALHAVSIDALTEEQRSRAVAQVMEAHRAHLRGGPELHPAARARAQLAVSVALAVRSLVRGVDSPAVRITIELAACPLTME